MRYLLDTCVISDFVKGEPNTSQRLKSVSPEDISVSSITSMELKRAGTPIGAYDVLIAATAIVHKLILVTANVREFERIPNLQIQNWRVSD